MKFCPIQRYEVAGADEKEGTDKAGGNRTKNGRINEDAFRTGP